MCAWRVDLRMHGSEVESESVAGAQCWWTSGESANGELAVSWWVLIKRIVLIDLRQVGRAASRTPTGVDYRA